MINKKTKTKHIHIYSQAPASYQKELKTLRASLNEACKLLEAPIISLKDLGQRAFRDMKNIFRDQVGIFTN